MKLAAIMLGATLLLSLACGGAAPATVQVALTEWTVTPNPVSVSAGAVTFDAQNVGALAHELVIIKTDRAPDALIVEGTKVDEAASGQTIGEIEEDELAPGQSASAVFNLTAGQYVLFCNIDGHYQSGMRAALAVQ